LLFDREPSLPLLYWNQFDLHLSGPLQIEKNQLKHLERKSKCHAARLQEIPNQRTLIQIPETVCYFKQYTTFQIAYKVSRPVQIRQRLIEGTYEIEHLHAHNGRRIANRRNIKAHLHENDYQAYELSFKLPVVLSSQKRGDMRNYLNKPR
jgi:hypothetical protein